MSEIDPPNWSDLGVSELLPTGTVTLLLADVEGSTRLWQTQPDDMTAAVARLDSTLADLLTAPGGGRPCRRPRPASPALWPTFSRPTAGYARSNRARATASSRRSPAPATRSRAHWT